MNLGSGESSFASHQSISYSPAVAYFSVLASHHMFTSLVKASCCTQSLKMSLHILVNYLFAD